MSLRRREAGESQKQHRVLINDRGDEQAEKGYATDAPIVCSDPQKCASLTTRTRQQVRVRARGCKMKLPRNGAPNHKIQAEECCGSETRESDLQTQYYLGPSAPPSASRGNNRTGSGTMQWSRIPCLDDWSIPSANLSSSDKTRVLIILPSCPGVSEALLHLTCLCPQF